MGLGMTLFFIASCLVCWGIWELVEFVIKSMRYWYVWCGLDGRSRAIGSRLPRIERKARKWVRIYLRSLMVKLHLYRMTGDVDMGSNPFGGSRLVLWQGCKDGFGVIHKPLTSWQGYYIEAIIAEVRWLIVGLYYLKWQSFNAANNRSYSSKHTGWASVPLDAYI